MFDESRRDIAQSDAFALTANEAAMFGVRSVGGRVVFRAAGSEWVSDLGLAAVTASFLAFASSTGSTWLVWFLVLSLVVQVVQAVLRLRQKVVLSSEGVDVTTRIRRRSFAWDQIDHVEVVPERVQFWIRGTTAPSKGQVTLFLGNGESVSLPGLRCVLWADDGAPDPVNGADAKAELIRRYRRQCAVGS